MPTAIAVTSPDLVLPPLDRQTPPAAVQPLETLEHTLNGMHALIEQHGYVIALYPASAEGPLGERLQRLRTVRSVLESDRIALLGIDLPPLGLALLAQQLRQLSVCDFSPGVLASSARLLAHYIYAGALLGSVAKLDRVPVTLKAHTKSWVPGAQFAVLANPRPQLVRIGQEELPGPEFGTRLLVAAGQAPSDWVTTTLAPAWQVQGVANVPLPEESARWWGTGRLVEFAAGLFDVSVLYQLVSSVRREECHWCGLELIGDRCGFCLAPLSATTTALAELASARESSGSGSGSASDSGSGSLVRAPAAGISAASATSAPSGVRGSAARGSIARALPRGRT